MRAIWAVPILTSIILLGTSGIQDAFGTHIEEEPTFNNPTPKFDEIFGTSVSISGDKVLIGAPNDDTGAVRAGSAYLFDTTGALLHTFNNPTPQQSDNFGISVSISGDKVLIGVPNDDPSAFNAGSAYLFDTTGALLHTFNNPTPEQSDNFGTSVSVSGDKVLIGALFDDTDADNAGSAYLFDTTGAFLHTYNNPTPDLLDRFGTSVSISGDKVLIGAPFDDFTNGDAGAAYLFDTTGTLLQTYLDSSSACCLSFGSSVSISGDKVLIGASKDDTGGSGSNFDAGEAHLFDTTGAFLHTYNNPTPEQSDRFGTSVSISGDKVLIGAPNDNTGAVRAGLAYLFDTTGATLHTYYHPIISDNNVFGSSVSISGDKVLIGVPQDETGAVIAGFNSGAVYLFDIFNSNPWKYCGSGTILQGIKCVVDPAVTQQIADLQADLATAQADLATAQADLATAQADLATAQADLATAQADLATAQADLATAQADLATTLTELGTALDDLNTAQADLATAQADLATAQADLATTLTELGTALDDLNTAQADLAEFSINFAQPILDAVSDLVSTNTLDTKDADSLIRTLDRSLRTAERAEGVACGGAESLVDDVNGLIADGTLTQTQAQPLLDRASELLATCTP